MFPSSYISLVILIPVTSDASHPKESTGCGNTELVIFTSFCLTDR